MIYIFIAGLLMYLSMAVFIVAAGILRMITGNYVQDGTYTDREIVYNLIQCALIWPVLAIRGNISLPF
jgi:hypothetical protein